MRIWDIDPRLLCAQHLLGEHRELHGLWNILTLDKQGYRRHPETRRWEGKLGALFARHARLVREMERRGYDHRSPLDERFATGARRQRAYVDSPQAQRGILKAKPCSCFQTATGTAAPSSARRGKPGAPAPARPRTRSGRVGG